MKQTVALIVFAFAALTLLATLFMPAAELIPAQVAPAPPELGASPVRSRHAMDTFESLGEVALKLTGMPSDLQTVMKNDPNAPYYVYSAFLSVALIFSAVAINAIGRFDSEEKTVLPAKK